MTTPGPRSPATPPGALGNPPHNPENTVWGLSPYR